MALYGSGTWMDTNNKYQAEPLKNIYSGKTHGKWLQYHDSTMRDIILEDAARFTNLKNF